MSAGAKSGGIEEAQELKEAGALSVSRDTALKAQGNLGMFSGDDA